MQQLAGDQGGGNRADDQEAFQEESSDRHDQRCGAYVEGRSAAPE